MFPFYSHTVTSDRTCHLPIQTFAILSVVPLLSDIQAWDTELSLDSSSSSPLALNHTYSPDSFPCSEHTCICLTWPFPLSQPYLDSSFYIYPSNICPTDLPASNLFPSPVLLSLYKSFSLNHHIISALCS